MPKYLVLLALLNICLVPSEALTAEVPIATPGCEVVAEIPMVEPTLPVEIPMIELTLKGFLCNLCRILMYNIALLESFENTLSTPESSQESGQEQQATTLFAANLRDVIATLNLVDRAIQNAYPEDSGSEQGRADLRTLKCSSPKEAKKILRKTKKIADEYNGNNQSWLGWWFGFPLTLRYLAKRENNPELTAHTETIITHLKTVSAIIEKMI